MRRTLVLVALGVSLGLLLAGCRDDTLPPVGPTPTASPAPAAPRFPDSWPGEPWILQSTLRSIDGPVACWTGTTGRSFEEWMAVERSDGSVRLRMGIEHDFADFTGTMSGNQFAVRGPSGTYRAGCVEPRNTTQASYLVESEASGHFAADGTTLIGTQLETYRAEGTGETIVLRRDWEGRRR